MLMALGEPRVRAKPPCSSLQRAQDRVQSHTPLQHRQRSHKGSAGLNFEFQRYLSALITHLLAALSLAVAHPWGQIIQLRSNRVGGNLMGF